MAKKKHARRTAQANIPSAATQLTTVIAQNGDANFNVDNADILAIAVSRAENQCNTEIKKADKLVHELEELQNKQIEAIKKTRIEVFAAACVIAVSAMRAFMESRGLKIEATHNYQERDEDGTLRGHSIVRGTRTEKLPNKRYPGNPPIDTVVEKLEYTLQVATPTVEELTKLEAENNVTIGELSEARKLLAHWRVQKSNIPSLERQVRANLAERRLAQTDEGKAILNSMASTLSQQLLPPAIDA